jgi:flagellar protein FliO/FliZ
VSLDVYTRFVVALIVIVALLAVFAWLARRFGFAGRVSMRGGRDRRLAIVEVAAVDNKHRLVLLRRDDVEHLVLIGIESAVVIESGIARKQNQRDFSTLVEGGAP